MRVKRGLLGIVLLLMLGLGAVAAMAQTSIFQQDAAVGERFLDVSSYLFKIAERNNCSLIIAQDVRSHLKQVRGKTVGEALNNYLADSDFSYRFYENCIFVADKRLLLNFLEKLPEDAMMLPKGKGDITISGIFHSVEISVLFKMLRSLTGVEVRPADGLRTNMMLRLVKMPWKNLVIAIVRLNDYKMIRSEFSVIVAHN
jgi:hypothetical protein